MTDLNTARNLAGPAFNDMSDVEVLGTLAEIERLVRRPLKTSEAQMYRDSLAARRAYLEKKAGKQQPEFVAEMYGAQRRTAADIASDSNEQGEG